VRFDLLLGVQTEDRSAFLMDLPSRGDCRLSARLEGAANDERMMGDLAGPDLPWLRRRRAKTFLYRHLLRFERRAGR
jgi:hypothetical protein